MSDTDTCASCGHAEDEHYGYCDRCFYGLDRCECGGDTRPEQGCGKCIPCYGFVTTAANA
jgi:hypothetical protein